MRHISQFPLPASILSLLESLSCGGFLLDLRGRVLSLNMLAVGCLGDGLVLGGDHLSAIDRSADLRLRSSLEPRWARPMRLSRRPSRYSARRGYRS